ncbi:MAG: ATP--guanido phosphotransferase [Thermoguttaceae bacterium]|nr:ATP--guanido phosphotransferase [Thermoguttaceae bacterium]
MKLDDLTQMQSAWLQEGGKDSDVVISSRIRLARNLDGYSFVGKATDLDLDNLKSSVLSVMAKLFRPSETTCLDFADVSNDDAVFLMERQLVSQEFVNSKRPRALLFHNREEFSVMVNEEDHLRLQATAGGFALPETWNRVNALDDKLESELTYAFDDTLGYLTASPANVGTGLRASVMLHLPGLVETGEIAKALRGLQKLNLSVRGLYGEGSRPLGEFFQVSNQTSLGVSEESIVDELCGVVPSLVEYERKARATMLARNREGVLDRCFRAMGLLKMARTMSMEEAMTHLSSLRLGVRLGLLEQIPIQLVDDLFLHIQPSHLKRLMNVPVSREKDDEFEEKLRADYIRSNIPEIEKK